MTGRVVNYSRIVIRQITIEFSLPGIRIAYYALPDYMSTLRWIRQAHHGESIEPPAQDKPICRINPATIRQGN